MSNQTSPVKFSDGAYSSSAYAESLLRPLFDNGTITPYPGAEFYAICYGELCAYRGAPLTAKLLAIWSAGVPDCAEDELPGLDYTGHWQSQPR